jgi:pimeloyl-ACP methyl ester carboxylesterase
MTTSSKVRLVIVDRPGIGGSDVLPRRTFASWADDVVELADSLGVERFGVVGWSGGGPYAAACAALIPARLTGVAIACSRHLSQFNLAENPVAYGELEAGDRGMYKLAQRDPDAVARAAGDENREWVRNLRERPETILDDFEPPDGFEDEKRRQAFFESIREGMRQGPEAFAWESIDVWLPWGFRVADITTEVHVCHGEQDTIVERRHIDFIVETLPDAQLILWSDSGHFGPARHWGEILEAVA